MKKLLLLFLLGIFIISCSMEDEDITYGQTELITYDATYDASNSDIFSELCHDQINNPTVRGFTNYYRNLIFLHTNIKNVNGSFEPTMTQLIDQYNQAGGTGTFSTLYSAETEEHGMIELRLTVEVKNCNSVCANDVYSQLCSDQISNPTYDNFYDYYRSQIFTQTGFTTISGTFEPTIRELYDTYNEAGGLGRFATNYTVDTEECGVITIEVAVQVDDCSVEEPVCANDVYSELCSDQINNPTYDNFYDYYRSQIFTQTGFTTISGTFEPTIRALYDTYNEAGGLGRFATNYTVDTEECGIITIEVAVQVDDCSVEEPVCANDVYSELCSDQINNPTYDNFYDYYRSQIFTQTGFTTISGTFEPTMRELYDTYNEAGGIGRFATNYTVDTEECGVLTIEVAVQVTDCQ